jgi:hypothetical protein
VVPSARAPQSVTCSYRCSCRTTCPSSIRLADAANVLSPLPLHDRPSILRPLSRSTSSSTTSLLPTATPPSYRSTSPSTTSVTTDRDSTVTPLDFALDYVCRHRPRLHRHPARSLRPPPPSPTATPPSPPSTSTTSGTTDPRSDRHRARLRPRPRPPRPSATPPVTTCLPHQIACRQGAMHPSMAIFDSAFGWLPRRDRPSLQFAASGPDPT